MAMLNYQMVHTSLLFRVGWGCKHWEMNSELLRVSWCVSTFSMLSTFKSQISDSILFNESYCLVNHMGWERTWKNQPRRSSLVARLMLPGCSVFAANSGWFSHQTPTDSADLTIHDWPMGPMTSCTKNSRCVHTSRKAPVGERVQLGFTNHSNFTMVYGTQITNIRSWGFYLNQLRFLVVTINHH